MLLWQSVMAPPLSSGIWKGKVGAVAEWTLVLGRSADIQYVYIGAPSDCQR